MKDRPQNTLILTLEPFVGFMPNDIRQTLTENVSEKEVAMAMAHVHNKVGSLFHELGESDDQWVDYAYEKWRELEEELRDRIILILEEGQDSTAMPSGALKTGWHYRVLPFMKRNGYRDGSGWWIEDVTE